MSMSFNNPFSVERVDHLIDTLDLTPPSHVLDIGCGNGELLIRTLERFTTATGHGVDLSAILIEAASARAEERLPGRTLTFEATDASTLELDPESFDAAICFGSTHAYGKGEAAYPGALDALTPLLEPGGVMLIGEGFWERDPHPDYLAFLGDTPGVYHTHAENVTFAEDRGLIPLYALTSTLDEWDRFEWGHRLHVERLALEKPDDNEVKQRLERSRTWRRMYLEHGRGTMGFGAYVFMKP